MAKKKRTGRQATTRKSKSKKRAPQQRAEKKTAKKKTPRKPAKKRQRLNKKTKSSEEVAHLPGDRTAGELHRERQRRRQAEISAATREIGPLPQIVDPARREACRFDFRLFCETYLPGTFYADWSAEQLVVISRIERTVLQGGLFAIAMPRGNGKSSLCEAAVIWSILFGHHHYVLLICATDDKFQDEARVSIKTELESNERLAADFPEVAYPIACLEGIAQRAKGQTLSNERTGMSWSEKGKRLVLPTVPGADASGAIISGGGLKAGTIRGSRYRDRAGRMHRPSLAIIDDPQTDDSAEHDQQCERRERLISSAILGTGGPDTKFSAVMPCTVIRRGDMADRLLDREKHPSWKGHRTAMILRWPDMEKWEEYDELRRRVLRTDDDLDSDEEDPAPEATVFVRKHFEEMHNEAEVSWESRRRPYHVSALQQAMDLYFRDRVGFFSEYQNWLMTPGSPADPTTTEDLHLDASALVGKLSGYDRQVCPPESQWVTGFIDCHDRALYWMLCAFAPDFTGAIIDYGTFPETRRQTFYVSSFRPTLRERFPGTGLEGALTQGLSELTDYLLDRNYRRSDGINLPAALVLIDTGYQTRTIRRFIEASRHQARLRSSLGRVIGPNDVPMNQFRQRGGELLGDDWILRKPIKTAFKAQHVLIDTYAWKTTAARRLMTAAGDPGAVTIYGKDGSGMLHPFLARHLAAEQALTVEGRTRVNEWRNRPGETENHWWDCFVGCCVAASMCGAKVGGRPLKKPRRRRENNVKLTGPDGRSFFITDR